MADDGLVELARAGEPDAWRALHRAHAGRLVAWLRTRPTGDAAAEPDDVAAEAWLVAASKIADFSGDDDQFAGWLFGIARHLQANARRRTDRRRTSPDGLEHAANQADTTLVILDQDWMSLLLAQLPPRERDAVGLIDALGLDSRSAAQALGVSAVALRVARHRGLKRLRDLMANEPHPEGAPLHP